MMRSAELVPVMDLGGYVPDAEFITMTVDDNNLPSRVKEAHCHFGYKIALLLEGTITGIADFKEYTATAPAVLFSSPQQVSRVIDHNNIKLIAFTFSKDFMQFDVRNTLSCWECMFNQMVIPVATQKDLAELTMYANLIQHEFTQLRHQKDLVIRNLMNAFLITAARLGTCETKITAMNATQNKILQQFRTLVEDHFLSKTHVAEYADMIYITPGHLNDTIKTITGKTAKQMIDEKRVTEAKRMLFWNELSVKQIASHLNFEDDAYFNRFFKKHTGQTPALFQRNSL